MPSTVGELMTNEVITVAPGETMDRVYDMMLELGIRHIPVVDEDLELVGLISHRDVTGILGDKGHAAMVEQTHLLSGHQAAEVMSMGLETVAPDTDLQTAADIMFENKISCLPVCEGTKLVGILTEADFVRYVAEVG